MWAFGNQFGNLAGGMRNYGARRQQRHHNGYAIMMGIQLLHQISQLPVKPPVTLLFIALNSAIYYLPTNLITLYVPQSATFIYRSVAETCLNPSTVVAAWRYGVIDWGRLFGSALIHADDLHLLYNMTSFLLKGVALETSIGSGMFLVTVVGLLILSQTLVVAISYILQSCGYLEPYYQCSIGFSGVLFALKYIISHRSVPGIEQIMFFQVPTRWAAWAELLLIQFMVPNASFMGHLCGILAGILWEHTGDLLRLLPLKLPSLPQGGGGYGHPPDGGTGNSSSSRRSRYTYARGTSASSSTGPSAPPAAAASAAVPTVKTDSDEDADIQEAIRQSLQQTPPFASPTASTDGWVNIGSSPERQPSASEPADQLRQRRLRRFGN